MYTHTHIHIRLNKIQSLTGLTIDQAKKPAFITALRKTLLSSMGAPDTAVVNIDFTSTGRRLLTSTTIKAKYDIAVESGLTEAALLSNLQLTLNNGAFIYYLKVNTGMTSLAVRSFALLKISPTYLPTAAPVEPNG